jgi:hypothetical protein
VKSGKEPGRQELKKVVVPEPNLQVPEEDEVSDLLKRFKRKWL